MSQPVTLTVGATTVEQDPVSGQVLTIHGTTFGNPTSGSLTVPPLAADPTNAFAVTVPLTLGPGTFTVSAVLGAGRFDPGLLTFTNASGTSAPQPGTFAVTIYGLDGNPLVDVPAVDLPADTTPPVMTGVLSVSNQGADGFRLAWPAASDDRLVAGYEYSLDAGATYIENGANRFVNVTGRTPSTTYDVRARAYDAAGNRAEPLLATATTTALPLPDTTAPVLTGTITVTNVTSTGFTMAWPVASDDTAVAGYEYNFDGTANYVGSGQVRSVTVNDRSPATTYQLHARAYDAAGNRSAPLTASVTTLAGTVLDTTPPAMSGEITVSNITSSGFRFSWPPAGDDRGVTGYEYSVNGGATYNNSGMVLGVTISGRAASTVYQLRARAYDAAGNRSLPLATSVTTLAPNVPAPSPPPAPPGVQVPRFSERLWSEEVGMADPEANFNAGPVLSYQFGGRTFVTDVNKTLYAPRDPADESPGEVPRGA